VAQRQSDHAVLVWPLVGAAACLVVLHVDGSCQVWTTLSSQAPDLACTAAAAARQHAVNSTQSTSVKGCKAAKVLQQLPIFSQVISNPVCNRSTSMQLLLSGQSGTCTAACKRGKSDDGCFITDLLPESVYTHAEPMVQSQVSSDTVPCQAVLVSEQCAVSLWYSCSCDIKHTNDWHICNNFARLCSLRLPICLIKHASGAPAIPLHADCCALCMFRR
jgi:hypothetical protein